MGLHDVSTLARLEQTTKRKRETEAGWLRLVRLARAEGHSLRSIADAAGVSHTAIANILAR